MCSVTRPNAKPETVMGNIKMKLLSIILSLAVLTSCDFKSSEDYHKEANKLEQEEKFKEAILLLDKAIEKDPSK